MGFGRRVEFEAVREVAFGSIGAAYTALGPIMGGSIRLMAINNATDADVYLSFDGIRDQIRIGTNSYKIFDFTANKVDDEGYFLSKNTQIFQKRVSGAPTAGNLWIEVASASGGQ